MEGDGVNIYLSFNFLQFLKILIKFETENILSVISQHMASKIFLQIFSADAVKDIFENILSTWRPKYSCKYSQQMLAKIFLKIFSADGVKNILENILSRWRPRFCNSKEQLCSVSS